MAYKAGNTIKLHVTAPDTPPNTRTTEQFKEFLEFVQQYVVVEDGNVVVLDITRIENELGLDNGQINAVLLEAQKATKNTSVYTSGTFMAMLYGMWAVQTKWEHIEEKPIVVTD